MKVDELIAHINNGERWFNNGRKRNRYVVSLNVMVLYKNKPSSNSTTGIWIDDFAKWAKGVGRIGA